MIELNQCKRLSAVVFFASALAAVSTVSVAEEFKRLKLPSGISLQVPAQWSVQTPDQGPGFSVAEAASKRATLLIGHSVPKGALLRLRLGPVSKLTPARLQTLKPEALAKLNDAFFQGMKSVEKEKGPNVVSMREPAVVSVSGHPALRLGYLRAGADGAGENWEVVQLQIPLADRSVHVTMSWSADSDATWRPMMERVTSSLQF
ncbi:hypothetical protein [Pseudomonas sp. H9]|uniref:hypothetical protein n=1 Tax=Pseudomonas sp. H9 TaxID=483968 RepID=UPI0010581A7A|nr:hypothetical protein [Pseudomonas sp. H9]TDF86251.1 hypothetical protein E1573_01390 [Pseudomonas sp. H9]